MQLMSGWKNIIVDSLFIARQHTDARYWYSNSVCLSVRPSVRNVPVSDENGLTYCHSFFHYTIAQSFKFYQHQKSSRHSDGITPCGGDKYKWGIKIFRFSTNKSLYLVNDIREHHTYYGRRIGTHMRSIKWCHFQWPWTNPECFQGHTTLWS